MKESIAIKKIQRTWRKFAIKSNNAQRSQNNEESQDSDSSLKNTSQFIPKTCLIKETNIIKTESVKDINKINENIDQYMNLKDEKGKLKKELHNKSEKFLPNKNIIL